MQKRSFGVTVLAFSSVMIALYCQFAAVSLILTGSAFSPTGSLYAGASLFLGAAFFGLTVAAYFLTYGLWTRKSWSWAGSIALFTAVVVASVALSVVSTNFVSSVLPLAGAVAAIGFLNRPAMRTELQGSSTPAEVPATMPEALTGAEPAR